MAYNYYKEQLGKIDTEHSVTVKFFSNGGDTNCLALNAESAKEIIEFLKTNYLKPKKAQPTVVIFRKFSDGEVIALFPYEVCFRYGSCMSYMHIGQHSEASLNGLTADNKLATKDEYQDLYQELISIGYTLKVQYKVNWKKYSNIYHKIK